MALLTDILGRIARQCSVTPPASWLSAGSQTALEILDFVDETAEDILSRVDLPAPMSHTERLVGSGAASYPMPAEYRRMQRAFLRGVDLWQLCVPVTTDQEWEYIKDRFAAGAVRYYRVTGYDGAHEIEFFPALDFGAEAVLSYMTCCWLVGPGGKHKSTFTNEADVCMLPRRLIETGAVARFRERKGLEYASKAAEFEALLVRVTNDARGRREITFGQRPVRGPFDIPIPDYIPPA